MVESRVRMKPEKRDVIQSRKEGAVMKQAYNVSCTGRTNEEQGSREQEVRAKKKRRREDD